MVLAISAFSWDVSATLWFVWLLVAAVLAVVAAYVWPQTRAPFPSPVPLGPDRVE